MKHLPCSGISYLILNAKGYYRNGHIKNLEPYFGKMNHLTPTIDVYLNHYKK